ncbi:MAG: hypothetical protein IPP69_07855 [Flavobacteriales bacterium]|nr:hypothetical protein [Flavobacteriales bacterium]
MPPFGANDLTNISEDWIIWRTSGNVPLSIIYRMEYTDGTFGGVGQYEYIAPGLDTTSILISY